jgi:tryptophan 2,3-dioxygenase
MTAILPIYQHQENHLPLYLLSESLVDFDQYFSLWREHHVRVVERIIGFKHGSGGSSGVGYLRSTTVKKMFPYLWEVRTYLEKAQ